jgi:hypothetical protein
MDSQSVSQPTTSVVERKRKGWGQRGANTPELAWPGGHPASRAMERGNFWQDS